MSQRCSSCTDVLSRREQECNPIFPVSWLQVVELMRQKSSLSSGMSSAEAALALDLLTQHAPDYASYEVQVRVRFLSQPCDDLRSWLLILLLLSVVCCRSCAGTSGSLWRPVLSSDDGSMHVNGDSLCRVRHACSDSIGPQTQRD
jgi:hypothetical protein